MVAPVPEPRKGRPDGGFYNIYSPDDNLSLFLEG